MGPSVLKEMGHVGTMFLRNLVTPLSGHSSEDARHRDSYLKLFFQNQLIHFDGDSFCQNPPAITWKPRGCQMLFSLMVLHF